MGDILQKIVESKRVELASTEFADIESRARGCCRPILSMRESLANSKSGIIAEFKRRSPSKGWINEAAEAAIIPLGYYNAGASACSVLTNREYFGGTLQDLIDARKAAPNLPILRKEFIIDERQIYEARVAGADAILLIASCLTPERCAELSAVAKSVGLEILLELHSHAELAHINPMVDMVGVNNRNLGSFHTDIQNSVELYSVIREAAREDMVLVSESGLSKPSTILELRELGYRGFLMGESFMKESDPAESLHKLIEELC
ncbi:MAG: indole-3-glycerol phosphate synthase TrpC [Rikenellaceae bacterium]